MKVQKPTTTGRLFNKLAILLYNYKSVFHQVRQYLHHSVGFLQVAKAGNVMNVNLDHGHSGQD